MPEEHPGLIKETTTGTRHNSKPTAKTKNPNTGDKTMTKHNTPSAAETTAPANTEKAKPANQKEESMTTDTRTPAALSRQVLADAQANAAECQRLSQQAEADAAAILARLASADTTVTALEWVTAKANQEIAAKLTTAAEGKAKRAELSLINDDFRLADSFADVLRGIYGRFVDVKIVGERRLVTKPEDARESVIYLVQEKATQDTGGIWSGNLRLTYHRSAVMSQLDGRDIEQECRARDWAVSISGEMGSELTDGQHQDTASVEVRGLYPPVPILTAAPTDSEMLTLARSAGPRVSSAVYVPGHDGVVLMNDYERPSYISTKGAHIVSTASADNGEHRAIVRMVFEVKPDDRVQGDRRKLMERAASEKCIGLAEHGSGCIVGVESFDMERVQDFGGKPGVVHNVGLRLTVTVDFVVAYRLA